MEFIINLKEKQSLFFKIHKNNNNIKLEKNNLQYFLSEDRTMDVHKKRRKINENQVDI